MKCEFFGCFINIIKCIVENLEDLKDISSIFLSIVTGVGVIRGFRYLKSLKEKTHAATFTFWSQLRVRLVELLCRLENNNGLICNLYTPETKDAWESFLPPEDIRVEEFKAKVIEAIQYIKSTPDQMPAYKGWTEDYNVLITFLNDAIQYDICNPDRYFKFIEQKQEEDMKNYCKEVCDSIRKMCEEIDKKQKEIEGKIF